jgi:hypothetical protein
MRVEFHDSEDKEPDYTTVFLEGRELGVFLADQRHVSIAKLVELAYERGFAAGKKHVETEFQRVINCHFRKP